MPLPRGYVFVPTICEIKADFADVTIIGDDGTPEGTLHMDGFATVMTPFPSVPQNSRFQATNIPMGMIKGVGKRGWVWNKDTHTEHPWKVGSIYLFAVPDTETGRKTLKEAKDWYTLFRLSNLIVEIHTR